jgi:hypothetical protein
MVSHDRQLVRRELIPAQSPRRDTQAKGTDVMLLGDGTYADLHHHDDDDADDDADTPAWATNRSHQGHRVSPSELIWGPRI